MIAMRECEHSVETSGRWHVKHPDRCFYCEYLQKHTRKVLYEANRDGQKRAKASERMKLAWKVKRGGLGA